MIKLKKLIKESAWDRKFGEPLPTLKDVTEKLARATFMSMAGMIDEEELEK